MKRKSVVHFFEGGFAAEADFAGVIDIDDFNGDEIAFVADIGDFIYAIVRHFGDMEQSVHSREDFDESAEIPDGDDFAAVDFTDFSFSGASFDAVFRSGELFEVSRHDFDGTVFFDVDAGAGFVGDGADIFTAGSDKGADFIGVDFDDIDTWSAGADIGAWSGTATMKTINVQIASTFPAAID